MGSNMKPAQLGACSIQSPQGSCVLYKEESAFSSPWGTTDRVARIGGGEVGRKQQGNSFAGHRRNRSQAGAGGGPNTSQK